MQEEKKEEGREGDAEFDYPFAALPPLIHALLLIFDASDREKDAGTHAASVLISLSGLQSTHSQTRSCRTSLLSSRGFDRQRLEQL